MVVYDVRTGNLTAANTGVSAAIKGTDTAAQTMTPPAGTNTIVHVRVSASVDEAAAEGSTFGFSLDTGTSGTQWFMGASFAGAGTAAGQGGGVPAADYWVNVSVAPGVGLPITVYMQGGDQGSGTVTASIGFANGPVSWGPQNHTFNDYRTVQVTAVNTATTLGTRGSSTSAGAIDIPAIDGVAAREIVAYHISAAGNAVADGNTNWQVQLVSTALEGGSQQLVGPGVGGDSTTTVVPGGCPATGVRTSMKIMGNQAIATTAFGAGGVDPGTVSGGFCVTFSSGPW